jgi:hypothetical protein
MEVVRTKSAELSSSTSCTRTRVHGVIEQLLGFAPYASALPLVNFLSTFATGVLHRGYDCEVPPLGVVCRSCNP